jgi:FMN phosphatase YigB (HAD superfamily)
VLLTAGDPDFQLRRVCAVALEKYFHAVKVVNKVKGECKIDALRLLAKQHARPLWQVAVIGNRCDDEIAGGRSLGMFTVWVRQGEGSEQPSSVDGVADIVVDDVIELAPSRNEGR